MPTYFQRPENALKRANGKWKTWNMLCPIVKCRCATWLLKISFFYGKYLYFCNFLKSVGNKSHIFGKGAYSFSIIYLYRSLYACLWFLTAEFIDVGKKQRALDALYDVIKSKKHRTWQKIHEPIMEKYLQLCVELRKSHIAKEGLYQYKNICQQVQPMQPLKYDKCALLNDQIVE